MAEDKKLIGTVCDEVASVFEKHALSARDAQTVLFILQKAVDNRASRESTKQE